MCQIQFSLYSLAISPFPMHCTPQMFLPIPLSLSVTNPLFLTMCSFQMHRKSWLMFWAILPFLKKCNSKTACSRLPLSLSVTNLLLPTAYSLQTHPLHHSLPARQYLQIRHTLPDGCFYFLQQLSRNTSFLCSIYKKSDCNTIHPSASHQLYISDDLIILQSPPGTGQNTRQNTPDTPILYLPNKSCGCTM